MAIPTCTGRGAFVESKGKVDHCCYIAGKVCEFLTITTDDEGEFFRCGLRVELGSWDGVNADPRYKPIGEFWDGNGHGFNYCETFDPAFCCRPEYRQGRDNTFSPLVGTN